MPSQSGEKTTLEGNVVSDYWKRHSRRQALRLGASGVGAAAVVALAGCGDDDTKPAATSSALASLNTPKAASTATSTVEPKSGGKWVSAQPGDPPTIDPYRNNSSQVKSTGLHVYSRLFMFASGPGVTPAPDAVVGDIVDKYEIADNTTYTLHLKENVQFHAPLSRKLTSEDVVFSYRRFKGEIPGTPAAVGNRLDIVDSISAPDEKTVVFKLKAPHGPFLNVLADGIFLQIMPKETGTAFDPAKTMVGSGPFMFDSYTPGTSIKFKRNPQWHFGPKRPYLDSIEQVFISEYTQQLNQFISGGLDQFSPTSDDIRRVVDGVKGSQVRMSASPGNGEVMFSLRDKTAPWSDPRVRQAMAVAIDQDATLDIGYSIDKLSQQGFKWERKLNNFVPHAWGDYSLDPKGSQISAEAKSTFQFDLTRAKQLLSAAGFASGFSADFHIVFKRYGAAFDNIVEAMLQWWGQIGIKMNVIQDDYSSVFIPKTYAGDFTGVSHAPQGGLPEPGDWLTRLFLSTSTNNSSKVSDPQLDQRINAIQSTLDANKRKADMRTFQDDMDKQMYYIPTQFVAGPTFTVFQANSHNVLEYFVQAGTGQPTEIMTYYWKDA
jgi:peptide/nickel transport system substrate-binding protein